MVSAVEPFNILARASNESIVKGCPGVQRTFPRIEGQLEIRSNNGLPIIIRKITLCFVNSQEASIPSSSGIGSTSASRAFTLFTTTIFGSSEELLGVDVPFILPIPTDAIASGEIAKYSMVNKTILRFTVTYGNNIISESNFEFPVPIKKYNTLPIYRQFLNPGTKVKDSSDRLTILKYTLENLSVGPGDMIKVAASLISVPQARNKKIKLKKLTMDLLEVIEFHDGGFPDKVTKLTSTQQEFAPLAITNEGTDFQISLECPSATPWIEMTVPKDNKNTFQMKSSKTLGKINSDIPLSHAQGFTMIGKLFSVRYELLLKLKISGAKDIELRQQVIVSPFDIQSSVNVLKWIMSECDEVSAQFGQDFDSNLEAAVKRAYRLADYKVTKYKNNVSDDWIRLGLGERAFSSHGKVLDYYID